MRKNHSDPRREGHRLLKSFGPKDDLSTWQVTTQISANGTTDLLVHKQCKREHCDGFVVCRGRGPWWDEARCNANWEHKERAPREVEEFVLKVAREIFPPGIPGY